nr:MAG TPA: hypothetical protein [Caudoviricetes sp.]
MPHRPHRTDAETIDSVPIAVRAAKTAAIRQIAAKMIS